MQVTPQWNCKVIAMSRSWIISYRCRRRNNIIIARPVAPVYESLFRSKVYDEFAEQDERTQTTFTTDFTSLSQTNDLSPVLLRAVDATAAPSTISCPHFPCITLCNATRLYGFLANFPFRFPLHILSSYFFFACFLFYPHTLPSFSFSTFDQKNKKIKKKKKETLSCRERLFYFFPVPSIQGFFFELFLADLRQEGGAYICWFSYRQERL